MAASWESLLSFSGKQKKSRVSFCLFSNLFYRICCDREAQTPPFKKGFGAVLHRKQSTIPCQILTPVQKAAEKCLWVKTLVETKELYHPLAWPVNKAYTLLKTVPELEERGLSVRIPNWWKHSASSVRQIVGPMKRKGPLLKQYQPQTINRTMEMKSPERGVYDDTGLIEAIETGMSGDLKLC